MKKTLLLTLLAVLSLTVSAQKMVGGDLSLVPAYESAGDQWLDANGNIINTSYSDGMITYVKEVAKWNSVRVRLLVNPLNDDNKVDDDYIATCQDLDYVKKLGKRIKDAGMNFLLDIFYSDTWTDVKKQWIPGDWGYDRNTATETLAAKVKSYTKEVLNTLVEYGAKPDYIQLGNEVSYGMLWDNLSGASKNKWFVTSSSYTAQEANIKRFAALLNAAKAGVDESNAAGAKIILHCERTKTAVHCVNFYNWVTQAGFTGYDIIGLSYYPIWHGPLSSLKTTLSQLQTNFPSKEIHIVEAGYQHTTPQTFSKDDFNTSATWPYTPEGQGAFMKDLVACLNTYPKVTGLYYWQPEECGNGADANGNNRVMNHWDNRGFWNISWKSGQHALNSKDALMAMMAFAGESENPQQAETDITDQFQNMDFEKGDDSGWTISYTGWGSGPSATARNEWHSGLTSGSHVLQGWVKSGNSLSSGNVIIQSIDNLPAGEYTISAVIHTDYNGIYLFANDDEKLITATSEWATAYNTSVTTTLATAGSLSIGLKLKEAPSTTNEVNLYADNFKVTMKQTSGIQSVSTKPAQQDNHWYTIDGRRLTGKPAQKGIYVNGGRKVVMK